MDRTRVSTGALLLVLVTVIAGLFVAVDAMSKPHTADRLVVLKARNFTPL